MRETLNSNDDIFQNKTDAMAMKSDTSVIEFSKFKAVVGQKEIDCKCKKMDELLSMLLTDN